MAGTSGISTEDWRTGVAMARSVGRGTAADPRRLAGSLSHRSDDARPCDTARSYPAIARAPLLGTATPTRTVGPHPSDGAERIERSRGIRDAGSAHPGCAVARNVRLQGHPPSRRWEDTGHATSPVAGRPSVQITKDLSSFWKSAYLE